MNLIIKISAGIALDRRLKKIKAGFFLLSMLLAAVLFQGCAGLKAGLGALRHPAAQAVAATVTLSPLDSVWRSTAPVDTVILQERLVEQTERAENFAAPAPADFVTPGKAWGYRVQLASSANRKELEVLLSRVEREFGVHPVIEEQQGRFSLRIGSFRKLESAEVERKRALSYGYKYAWMVQTQIPLEDFKPEE